jgi:cytochrome bd-type quinol oxidase subunit 1
VLELRVRTYLIGAFAFALLLMVVVCVSTLFAIMGSRVWIALRNMGISEATMASLETNISLLMAAQMVIYAILGFFGLKLSLWALEDKETVEHLESEIVVLKRKIDEIKTEGN